MKTKKRNYNKLVFAIFVVSKPFKVIFIDFFAKKQKLRNSVF